MAGYVKNEVHKGVICQLSQKVDHKLDMYT